MTNVNPDPVEALLASKMSQPHLDPADVCEGMVACFVIINREFVRRRMGERPIAEVDRVTQSLIDDVFEELGIDPQHPLMLDLRKAWKTLDDQLGFEAEPDLMSHHHNVVSTLLERTAEDA